MATKFSSINWRVADSQIRNAAGARALNPPPVLFREMANIILMYVWRILDGKVDVAYRKTANLTLAADQDTLQKAAIAAMDLAGSFQYIRGATYAFRTGDRIRMQGFSTTEQEMAGFRAIVADGGLTARLVDIEINGPNQGYVPTLADYAAGAAVIVEHSQRTLVADLSSLFMKRIVGVSDSGGTGGTTRIWEVVQEYRVFHDLANDVAYDGELACYQRGDVLLGHKGVNASAVVNPVLEYDGIPELYTIATKNNEIQLFQEYFTMWYDLMLGWTMDWLDKVKEPALEAKINAHLQMINEAMQADAQRLESART